MAVYVEVSMDKKPEVKSFRLSDDPASIFRGKTGWALVICAIGGLVAKVLDMLK